MRILVLVAHWDGGFGVARVVREQVVRLAARGHDVTVGCMSRLMDAPPGVELVAVPWKAWGLRTYLEEGGWDCVVAHTQDFMEAIASCTGPVRILYDHGEPPPDFFPEERVVREAAIRRRKEYLAPAVDHVVCISEFMRRSIGIADALVVHNGADHLEVVERKSPPRALAEPLRLLCISRMGRGERTYKGLTDLVTLAASLKPEWATTLAGRGSPQDREELEAQGLEVVSNPSDAEMAGLIADCDALVSLSRWEGFNLPLVEAGIAGKAAYALDHGPHREVVPIVFQTVEEMGSYLASVTRGRLAEDGKRTREHVSRFRWDRNVDLLEDHLQEWTRGRTCRTPSWRIASIRLTWWIWGEARRLAGRGVRTRA